MFKIIESCPMVQEINYQSEYTSFICWNDAMMHILTD
uniref:Uncharacterized protein n=1 Tax=Anguilla anguilla TaxID=7936 RepID=A0A0E9TZW0_ANGAN